MQIVIDIPEEMMSYINKNEFNAISEAMYSCLAMIAIKTGTPLPKGHGRLVDVDEVIKIANKTKDLHGAIWNAPTIIEADKEVQE